MTDTDRRAQPHGLRFAEHRRGEHRARWLATVDEAYSEIERRIDAATTHVRVETYILREDGPGTWLAAALLRARARGVTVQLLLDAFGCEGLREGFLESLRDAGVQVAIFNPRRWLRRSFRNHRKLVACDGAHAIVGGFNIAPEYAGNGVTHGWCDTGVYVGGPVVSALERSFDAMFALAPFTARTLRRFIVTARQGFDGVSDVEVAYRAATSPRDVSPVLLLVSGPGLPGAQLRRALLRDLAFARSVWIASGYFLPGLRIRRMLYRAARRREGRVRVLLAGRSDVPVARLAAEHLYARLLRRRVRLHEYQPQILHAKLGILDNVVHVGSCNLDRRSLHINFELLLRFDWPEVADDARRWYKQALARSSVVSRRRWRVLRGPWRRLLARWSYWLLARVDPLIARRGFRSMS